MAGDWKKERLSALCSEIADCPHSTPLWTDSGVIVLRSQNIRNGRLNLSTKSYTDEAHFEQRSRRARLQGGDLVITREAPMGEVCLIPDGLRCCLGQRMVMLRPDPKKCDSRFLLYSIQSRAVQDEIKVNEGTGSTVSNLRIPLLEALPIPHPPLAEQKAIAAVLGALDDKIELNRRMNATLESMARALFQSWFVDFDPVRAKLDARQFEGIDPEVFRMLPDTFETTEDGMLPTGWKFCPLTEVYDVSSGLSKPRAEFGFGHPFLTFTNVMNNRFIPQSLTSLVNSSDAERSRCTVERGDVFLTRTSETQEELGMSCAALQSYPQATFNGFTKRLRPKGASPLLPEYAGFYFRSAKFRRDVTAMSSLSTRASLNNEMLSRLKVLLPPPLICEAFANHVSPMLRRMQSNEVESKQLATLRDTLLPRLLSGELSVVQTNNSLKGNIEFP